MKLPLSRPDNGAFDAHKVAFGILILAILLAGLCACTKTEPIFDTHWSTETQFIVESTAIDLAGMAYYARHGQAVEAGQLQVEAQEIAPEGEKPLTYRLRIRHPEFAVETTLPVTGSIWDPAMYQSVVELLFDRLQIDPAKVPSDASIGHASLRELTGATAETIERENGMISAGLAAHFLTADRHDQAALLLAAFTLREHSGKFFEIRSELCRMTAHLAFAQAVRRGAPATLEGQLAAAGLAALYGDQRAALRLIDGLPAGEPSIEAWSRAWRIRITGDYRLLTGVKDPTLLERREAFAAKVQAIDVALANGILAKTDQLRNLDDWSRILNARKPGVEIGHEILRRSVGDEINEARQVFLLATGEQLDEAAYVEKLNAEPEPCVAGRAGGPAAVRVIGWGHWAAFLQRHLCHAIASDFRFLQEMLGAPGSAQKYRESVDGQYGRLRLYPFVRRQNATEKSYYRQAQDAEMVVVHHRPHLVPATVWAEISDMMPFGIVYIPPPQDYAHEWHRFNPLPGTAYDLERRLEYPSLENPEDIPALLTQLHTMAPYDFWVTRRYLGQSARSGEQSSGEGLAMEKAYGPVLEFNSKAIAAVAEAYKAQPERYERWMSRAAEIDPLWDYSLGEFYAKAGRDADAARAYEQIISIDADTVRASNQCEWLVYYYERKGAPGKATELAERAAQAYSRSGLELMADLLEKRRDFPGAIGYYRKAYERYGFAANLVACLTRYQRATGRTDYAGLLQQVMGKALPRGLVRIEAGKFSGPPKKGVVLVEENSETRKVGLEFSDIIVGIRGYRVEKVAEYQVVCDLEPNTPFTLQVWRDGRCIEIRAAPPRNRFGVRMGDYEAE